MKIVYSADAAERCRAWVNGARDGRNGLVECGWLGRVEVREGPVFYVPEVHFLRQTGSGGAYNATAAAVAEFYAEFIAKGGDPQAVTHFGHSHAMMSVFQSGVDRDNVAERFMEKGWCVAVTWNGRGEMYGEVTWFRAPWFKGLKDAGEHEVFSYVNGDGEHKVGVRFVKVPVVVEQVETAATAEAMAEMKEKFALETHGGYGRWRGDVFEGFEDGDGFDDHEWMVVDGKTNAIVTTTRTKKEAKEAAKDLGEATKGLDGGQRLVVEKRPAVRRAVDWWKERTKVDGQAGVVIQTPVNLTPRQQMPMSETTRRMMSRPVMARADVDMRDPATMTDGVVTTCLLVYAGNSVEVAMKDMDATGVFYFKETANGPRLFLKWRDPVNPMELHDEDQMGQIENKRLALKMFRKDCADKDPNVRRTADTCSDPKCKLDFRHGHNDPTQFHKLSVS